MAMTKDEIMEMIKQIHKKAGIPEPEPFDFSKLNLRPDQISFYEGLERGDHLDVNLHPL